MATNVYLPALGMAQETGVIVRWLKAEGDTVKKGEALFEVETDKATVEIEASANGYLANVTAAAGDEIPVGQVIAVILAAGESSPKSTIAPSGAITASSNGNVAGSAASSLAHAPQNGSTLQHPGIPAVAASPLASRIAAEHHLDLGAIKPAGRRIQKADVLTYIRDREDTASNVAHIHPRLFRASPKARRLAREQQKELATIQGSGPEGAVLAVDVHNAPAVVGKTVEELVGAELASALPIPSAPTTPPLSRRQPFPRRRRMVRSWQSAIPGASWLSVLRKAGRACRISIWCAMCRRLD